MNTIFNQKLKEKRIENSSSEFQNEYKRKMLDEIISQISNKENRFIFYCPDIALVNNICKNIYETAFALQTSGFNVLILHETENFKCKWILEEKGFRHLNKLNFDSIIKKKGKKSSKTSSTYAFKPSDTLIVPDQFQEMLENLIEVKLVQKVVMVNSFSGLSSLTPGVDYKALGADRLIFNDTVVAEKYLNLFPNIKYNVISGVSLNREFYVSRNPKEVMPLITVSNIGNVEFVQQMINIFYNKYPNLRVFNFRILDRDNLFLYKEGLFKSAIVLFLDKFLDSKNTFYEALKIGTPIGSTFREEFDTALNEEFFIGNTPFEIADNLAKFCTYWLETETKEFDANFKQIINLGENNVEFETSLKDIFNELHESRVIFYDAIKKSIKENV